jgi:putative ABC transport system permease protein
MAESPGSDREARVRFGNIARIQEDSRAAWGWPTIESIGQDVRYGIRTLAASPAFTITAIVSLTLGIGANTAIFSLLNAIMLRTLPVKDPSRLVRIEHTQGPIFTNPMWEQIRGHPSVFDGSLAYGDAQYDLSNGGVRQFANGLLISGDYFRTLGVPAIRGRVITTEDDKRGCGTSGPVAVISHRFWLNHFEADPAIVGRTLTLDRVTFQIAGVTPAWFTGLNKDLPYEVAVPLGCEPLFHTDRSALDQRSWWWLRAVGRLKPDMSLEATRAQLSVIAPEIMRATVPLNWKPDGQKEYLARTLAIEPASTGFSGLGRQYGKALFTLQAVVAIVLLIACANVANLLLARATARQRELTVRLAIGAGRGRIVRQLLTESLLLAASGAMAGLLLAAWGTKLLVHMLNSAGSGTRAKPYDFELDTSLDLTVVGFTALVVVLTTLFFGLLPALRASATEPNAVLKEHGRGSVTGGGGRLTLANMMVAIQIGLALTLLSAATLFGESFRRILTVDSGFDVHNVVLIPAEAPQALLEKSQRIHVFNQALDQLREIPGVAAASRSELTPLSNSTWNENLYPDGYHAASTAKSTDDERLVYFNNISPGYFRSMGAKLIAGRDFDAHDALGAPRVMIIGETTARAFWGSESPLGRIVKKDSADSNGTQDSYQIVGVVNDMKYESLSEKTLKTGFVPASQDPNPRSATVFELRLDSMNSLNRVLPMAREALSKTNKNLSLEFQTFDSQVADSLIRPRLIAVVSGFFGAVALILAATGLYGAIAYSTARRKSEIGLRVALGASYGSVVWLVLREIGLTLLVGTAIGLTAARFAGNLVTSLIYGVHPTDPAILGVALGVLVATAAVAAYIPARRAARLDPMDSLRIE